nr:hypothetical protein BaRGS_024843 [Batillaria attramentaria]
MDAVGADVVVVEVEVVVVVVVVVAAVVTVVVGAVKATLTWAPVSDGVPDGVFVASVQFVVRTACSVIMYVLERARNNKAVAYIAASRSGYVLNRLDLAPRFAGSLAAIGNTLTCVGQIVNPLITSAIVSDAPI